MKPFRTVAALALLVLLGLPGVAPVTGQNAPTEGAIQSDWTWHVETVDATGNVGQYTSLVVDANGSPHISYYGSSDLKYAEYDGTSWIVQALDAAGDTGLFTSIAHYGAGNIGISYYDSTNGDLKYTDLFGGITVDSTGDTGQWTSLAFDGQGLPHISYYDAGAGNLRYAYYGVGGWHTQTVDSTGDVGRYTSLALRATNRPCISYFDVTNGSLKYAEFDPVDWSWVIQVVEAGLDQGQYTSLALDAGGRPHITYASVGGANLKYAYYDGVSWYYDLIDVGTYGHNSLALDAAGRPHVSYWSPAGLRYATYAAPGQGNCGTGAWTCETVDPGATLGAYNSLYLDTAGEPHISYRDDTNMDLKYASACLQASFTHTPEPACVFAPVHFTSTVTGTAPFSYQWSFGDGATSTLDDPVHSYDQPGIYTAALTVTAGCGIDTFTNTVTVWGTPVAGYTYVPPVVCAAAPVSFTNTTVASGTVSYQWNFDDGTSSPLTNPTHTWAVAGVYDVALLAQNGCGFDLYSENVPVHTGPQVGIAWAPDPPEIHQPVTFMAQATSTLPVAFVWNLGGITRTGAVVTHTYDVAGTYAVTLTGDNGCGQDSAMASITVVCYPAAGPDFSWIPVSPTVGFPVSFTGHVSGTVPVTYTWTFGDGVGATGPTVTHAYATTGTFTVTMEATNDCGQVELARAVRVAGLPQARFTSNAPVCLGEPAVFDNLSTGVPPLFFHWDLGDGITSTLENPTHTYALAQIYTATLAVTNSYGTSAATHTVEVLAAAAGATFTVSPPSPDPSEQLTFVAAAGGAAPISYTWDFGDGSHGTGQVALHTYPLTGTYAVVLTASNACGSASISTTVEVAYCHVPAGLGIVYTPRPLLASRPATFTATLASGDAPVNYSWEFGDGTPPTTGPVVPHSYGAPGVYTITLTALNVCGLAHDEFPVVVAVPVYRVYLPLVLRGFWVDGYEPDGTPAQAQALGIGSAQQHNLNPAGDVDWIYVDLTIGRPYLFATGDLGGTADTVLELYDTDGTTLLAQNDDCDPYTKASCLTISAPASGRYYLKVRDYLPEAGGTDNVYTLTASEQ